MTRRIILLAVLIASLATATPASAHITRPIRPPLPNPLPQIVTMAANDPVQEIGAGYFDGQTVHVIDVHDKFLVRHELGHVYDNLYLDARERQRFANLLHCDRYGCDGEQDLYWTDAITDPDTGLYVTAPDSLSEVFADAYAACRSQLVIGSGHTWETGYGYQPATNREHLKVCAMIARASQSPGQQLAADGWR